MDEEKQKFASYNAMNRPALFMGIPLMIFISVAGVALVTGFPAMYFWGPKGLLVPSLFGLFLFVVKLICEGDPNALAVMKWRIKGKMLRIKTGSKILTFNAARDERAEKQYAKQLLKRYHRD